MKGTYLNLTKLLTCASVCVVPYRHGYLKLKSQLNICMVLQFTRRNGCCSLIFVTFLPAKLLIPRQFVGWSCLMRNLQQASRTVAICRMDEAGKRTCTFSSDITISPRNQALQHKCLGVQKKTGSQLSNLQ